MAADDFEVIVYKLLSYLYACIKGGVEPSPAKAKEVAGVNDVHWLAVVRSVESDGLAEVDWLSHWAGRKVNALCITGKGAEYLKDNSKMGSVFWSSDVSTGTQTFGWCEDILELFWSSDVSTSTQTYEGRWRQ